MKHYSIETHHFYFGNFQWSRYDDFVVIDSLENVQKYIDIENNKFCEQAVKDIKSRMTSDVNKKFYETRLRKVEMYGINAEDNGHPVVTSKMTFREVPVYSLSISGEKVLALGSV